MGNNTIPFIENGMMNIRGVKVELLATPSQTWDITIHGVVYHITQDQEAYLLRTVLYHNNRPSPHRITQLSHSGKEKKPLSPATLAQMVAVSHTCIDTTNKRKSCSDVSGIRGYGYMNKWQAFCYCIPYSIAIYLWLTLTILMGSIIMWFFDISPGTTFSVNDSVSLCLIFITLFTGIELCFKPGREYLRKWFNHRWLILTIVWWAIFVIATAIECHKPLTERSDNLAMALAPIIATLGALIFMFMSAMNCYLLVDSAIKEGEDIDTIDKYV